MNVRSKIKRDDFSRDEKAGNLCSGKTFKIEEFDAEQTMKKKLVHEKITLATIKESDRISSTLYI
jgi:hypothetical protein